MLLLSFTRDLLSPSGDDEAARRAFENPFWRRMPPAAPSKLMYRLADLIEDNAEELAILESLDNGKPVRLARAKESRWSSEASPPISSFRMRTLKPLPPKWPTPSSSTRARFVRRVRGSTCIATATTQVTDEVADMARRMKIGPGLNPDSQLGSLVSHEQRERVHAYVDGGREDGAEVVVAGGNTVGFRQGLFLRAHGADP